MIHMMMMKIDIPGSAHAASTWGLTIHILLGCSLQLHTQSASGQRSLQTVTITRKPIERRAVEQDEEEEEECHLGLQRSVLSLLLHTSLKMDHFLRN